MKVRILGCSGGVGGAKITTTSLLVDHDILIDAGTGAAQLSLEELTRIDHIFLTHAHLDHIAHLPLIIDSVGDKRHHPLNVYATTQTIAILKEHIFNWKIWPDFTHIPSRSHPFLVFHRMLVGESIRLAPHRTFTALPANHTVPAVGYQLTSEKANFVFTGDTTTCDELWQVVNTIPHLKTLIIESAFPDHEKNLAIVSKHLCPSLLEIELGKLTLFPDIFITHAKPGQFDNIKASIAHFKGPHKPQMLLNNQVFEF